MPLSWRGAVGILALLLAATTAVLRPQVYNRTFLSDYRVICSASAMMEAGGNPYDQPALAAVSGMTNVPLSYPALAVRMLAPACGRVSPLWAVMTGWLALLILTARLPGVGAGRAMFALLGGFAVLPWIVLTGNIVAVIEGFCGLAAVWAMVRSRPAAFGAAIGAAAFVKLMPAAYLAAAVVRWSPKAARRAVAAAIVVFVALEAVSLAVAPDVFGAYWTAVATGWDGYVQSELRFGTENNPSMYSFVPIATTYLGLGRATGFAIVVVVALGLAAAWWRRWREQARSDTRLIWLGILAIGVITVVSPRFKPYTATFLLPALALGFGRLPAGAMPFALLAACLLPNAALLALTAIHERPGIAMPIVFLLQYAQWVTFAGVVAMALRRWVMAELGRTRT